MIKIKQTNHLFYKNNKINLNKVEFGVEWIKII